MLNRDKPSAAVTIRNRKGCTRGRRPSSSSAPKASMATVRVTRDGQTVDGTSIMGLMMLAAGPVP